MKKTFSLLALGAFVLAGCDFAGSTDSATAPIASIQASQLAGAASQTDLFIEVQDVTGRSYYRSAQTSAVDGTLTIRPEAGVALPSATMPVHIAVYDFDGSFQDSRLIARSAAFTAERLSAEASVALADGGRWRTFAGSDAQFTVSRSAE